MRPGITLIALITLFGVYAMADGLFAIVAAIRGIHAGERWGWMMFEGIVGVVVGAIALTNHAIGALALTWLVAGWALSTGVLEIIAGIRLRKIMTGEWLLLVAGVLSVILAFLIISRPRLGRRAARLVGRRVRAHLWDRAARRRLPRQIVDESA